MADGSANARAGTKGANIEPESHLLPRAGHR